MAKLRFKMFKVDSLKVMQAVLERIKLQVRVVNTVGNAWKINQGLEETDDCEELQLQATTNFKADHVETYDSDCDDEATTNAIFMASLSPVGSINDDTVEPNYDSDILSESYDELTSNNNVISYADYMVTIGNDVDNYVPPLVQNIDMILFVIKQMKSKVERCNTVNQETQSVNESLTKETLILAEESRLKMIENKLS
ncbi:hypothetical protein Tco_0368917 [Tanacetum coccineum]